MRFCLLGLIASTVAASDCNLLREMYQTKVFDDSSTCCTEGALEVETELKLFNRLVDVRGREAARRVCSASDNSVTQFQHLNLYQFSLEFANNALQLGPAFQAAVGPFFASEQFNPGLAITYPTLCEIYGISLTDEAACARHAGLQHELQCGANHTRSYGVRPMNPLTKLPIVKGLMDALTPEQCASPPDANVGLLCALKMVTAADGTFGIPCLTWLDSPLPPGVPDIFRYINPIESGCYASNYEAYHHFMCACGEASTCADNDDDICNPYASCPRSRTVKVAFDTHTFVCAKPDA